MAGPIVTLDRGTVLDLIYLLRIHEAYQQAVDQQQAARCYALLNRDSGSELTRETVRLREQLELDLV